MEFAQTIINAVVNKLGLDPITISSISGYRWILNDRDGLGPEMIRIEKQVREYTNEPIDLRVVPKSDKNKRFDRNYLRGVDKL